jgi:hypothetical protein
MIPEDFKAACLQNIAAPEDGRAPGTGLCDFENLPSKVANLGEGVSRYFGHESFAIRNAESRGFAIRKHVFLHNYCSSWKSRRHDICRLFLI